MEDFIFFLFVFFFFILPIIKRVMEALGEAGGQAGGSSKAETLKEYLQKLERELTQEQEEESLSASRSGTSQQHRQPRRTPAKTHHRKSQRSSSQKPSKSHSHSQKAEKSLGKIFSAYDQIEEIGKSSPSMGSAPDIYATSLAEEQPSYSDTYEEGIRRTKNEASNQRLTELVTKNPNFSEFQKAIIFSEIINKPKGLK